MVGSSPSDSKARGSAVLVHGLWGYPDDWQWVRPLLEAEGIQVVTPDLPSERSSSAGRPMMRMRFAELSGPALHQ